jgi:hypothetical protein
VRQNTQKKNRMRSATRLTSLVAPVALVLGSAFAAAQDPPKPDAQPVLSVLGASAGEYKITSNTAAVAFTLIVESNGDKEVAAVVRAGPFRDARGQMFPAHIAAINDVSDPKAAATTPAVLQQAITVPAKGSVRVGLAAALGADGDYTAEFVVVEGTQRHVTKLTVARATGSLGLELLGLENVQVDLTGADPTATLRYALAEQLGRGVTTYPPQLIATARKEGTVRYKSDFSIVIEGASGVPVVLRPGETQSVVTKLQGFEGPGEYVGKLRVAAAGLTPKDVDFTVYLRQSGWMAFWALFAGAVLSFLLPLIARKFRPKLVARQRLEAMALAIDADVGEPGLESAEIDALNALRREARDLLRELKLGEPEKITGRMDLLAERRMMLRRWIPARRRVNGLSPAELREQMLPFVNKVRDVALSFSATKEDIAAQNKTLDELESKIEEALRKELKTRVGLLRQQVAAATTARPSSKAAEEGSLVEKRLAKVEKLANENNLVGALAEYRAASEDCINLLLDDFAASLTLAPPLPVKESLWSALVQKLRREISEARALIATDVDSALRGYEAAIAEYVDTLCTGAEAELKEFEASLEEPKNKSELTDEKKAAIEKNIAATRAAVTSARAALRAGRIQEALAAVADVIETLNATLKSLSATRGKAVSGKDSVVMSFVPPDLLMSAQSALSAGPADAQDVTPASAFQTTLTLAAVDIVTWLVAIIITTLLGLKALWFEDPTWGGVADISVAFLWGLGLQGFAFQGLGALRDRLLGPTSSPGATP